MDQALDDSFTSVPASLWWSIQTLTTVGYGDLISNTLAGKVFACCFMLLGAVTVSLPILTVVSQFVRLYPKNIELVSNTGEEKIGGRGSDIQIPRQLSGIR